MKISTFFVEENTLKNAGAYGTLLTIWIWEREDDKNERIFDT